MLRDFRQSPEKHRYDGSAGCRLPSPALAFAILAIRRLHSRGFKDVTRHIQIRQHLLAMRLDRRQIPKLHRAATSVRSTNQNGDCREVVMGNPEKRREKKESHFSQRIASVAGSIFCAGPVFPPAVPAIQRATLPVPFKIKPSISRRIVAEVSGRICAARGADAARSTQDLCPRRISPLFYCLPCVSGSLSPTAAYCSRQKDRINHLQQASRPLT